MTRRKSKAHQEPEILNPGPEHRRLRIDDLEAKVEEIRESHQQQIIKLSNQILNVRQQLNRIEDDLANHGVGGKE